jgi:hypothetical protein
VNLYSSPSRGIVLALLFLNALVGQVYSADFRAMNYDTPAFIEVELQDLHVHSGSQSVTINVIRSGEFRVPTRVDYETVEGTAIPGRDFKAVGGTLVFNPGEGYKSITVELLSPEGASGEKTFQLRLASSSPNTIVLSDTVTVRVQQPPAPISDSPKLHIESLPGNEVLLSWESTDNFRLERTHLGQSADWEPVATPLQTDGARHEIRAPSIGAFIYRLRRE